MTSEGFGEMFEDDSADTCAEHFPFKLMGAQVEGLAHADPVMMTPIDVSENCHSPTQPQLNSSWE